MRVKSPGATLVAVLAALALTSAAPVLAQSESGQDDAEPSTDTEQAPPPEPEC